MQPTTHKSGHENDRPAATKPTTARQISFGLLCSALVMMTASEPAQAGCNDPPEPGVDWRGCDLSWSDLKGKNLSNANLVKTKFLAADLEGAKLKGANLQGASLVGANLQGADFENANLNGAFLTKSRVAGANFTNTKLNGTYWANGIQCGQDSIGKCTKLP